MYSMNRHRGSVQGNPSLAFLLKSSSKAVLNYLQNVDTTSLLIPKDDKPQNLDKFSADALAEDIHGLLKVAGFELYCNRPQESLDWGEPPIPTLDDVDGAGKDIPPETCPQELEALEAVYHLQSSLLAAYEGEKALEIPFYRKPIKKVEVPSLQDLGIAALQDLFKREDDKFNSYLNARLIPASLRERCQEILPPDIPVVKAALAIDEGIFWKRLIEHHYPYIYCNPITQCTTYKSVFLQEWLSDYLSKLEPEYTVYCEVQKNILAVSIWIFDLDIKGLKPPKFSKTEPPKRNMPDEQWESVSKETCFVVDPYPQKINITKILQCLSNLRNLSICYGFENYERVPTFQHSRINTKDIDNLGRGLALCQRLVSLRIHKSAIYSQDIIVLCKALKNVPLKKLEVSSCFVDNEGVLGVCDLIKHHEFLEVLDLSRNKISENGAYNLAMSLIKKDITPLRSLGLSFNMVGDIGAMFLGLMLSLNKTLGSLVLSACGISGPGGRVIAAGLQANSLLLRLDLSANRLGEQSGRIIEQAAKLNTKVEHININECDIPDDIIERVNQTTKTHRTYNRAYYIARTWAAGQGDSAKYCLVEGRETHLRAKPFPSYSCPKENMSPSDTASDVTGVGNYNQDPILPRYISEFDHNNTMLESKRVYLNYLKKKMNKNIKKGVKKLYAKGSPLLKLMNYKEKVKEKDIIHEY